MRTGPVNTRDMDRLIRQKESKVADYRKDSGISFEIMMQIMPIRKFDFDKIILFDTFKGVAIRAFDKPV